jgi:DHA1 family tetracycline resistance protein-like MFS transporter
VGTAILGAVSHLAPQDWRIGSSFYMCAAMQALAVLIALRTFRKRARAAAAQPTA